MTPVTCRKTVRITEEQADLFLRSFNGAEDEREATLAVVRFVQAVRPRITGNFRNEPVNGTDNACKRAVLLT